jgi:uncharacterized protein with HEPN domain
MRPRVVTLLEDIERAAAAIRAHVGTMTDAEYHANELVSGTVNWRFITIGEALRRLVEEAPEMRARITRPSDIIGFRNVLAHGYDSVDDFIVWNAIQKRLPILVEEIRALIAEERARS